MHNITQAIKNSYKTWESGNIIFILAGTGTGKTYFILHSLYEFAIERNNTIVLLVNRRILKRQILHDLKEYDARAGRKKHQILVFTYQEIESAPPDSWQHQCIQDAQFLICDEAHYFRADSTFNPGTAKSFELVTGLLPGKITIFMTATPGKIMPAILEKAEHDYQEQKARWDEAITSRNLNE